MSRQKFEKTFNTFTKGLMTEASELNFPEDFSLYEKNFLLHRDGGRDRRKGMELLYPLGLTLTSKVYPLEDYSGIASVGAGSEGGRHQQTLWRFSEEVESSRAEVVRGVHRFLTSEVGTVETLSSIPASVVRGVHRELVARIPVVEEVESSRAEVVSGVHKNHIRYTEGLPEELISINAKIVGGTHG